MSDRLPPTRQDLVRWSEALAGIARTGLGFTESLYERERFEEVLAVAADIRASLAGRRRARRRALRRRVDAQRRRGRGRLRHAEGRGRRGRATTTQGEILLVQRADSGVWLYPTGWADVGYSAGRGGGEGGARGDRHRVRGRAAHRRARRPAAWASPASRSTRWCSTAGPSAASSTAHPLETARRRLVRRGRAARAMTVGVAAVGRPRLRRHPRRAGAGAVRPAPAPTRPGTRP